MTPTVTDTLQAWATELRPQFAGIETHPEAAQALEKWVWRNREQHRFVRATDGTSGCVWLGDSVVVKICYPVMSFDEVPEPYRPEQVTVWEGYSPQWRRQVNVVVQPRYELANARQFPDLQAAGVWDARAGNWGLRKDGSPVLFDC